MWVWASLRRQTWLEREAGVWSTTPPYVRLIQLHVARAGGRQRRPGAAADVEPRHRARSAGDDRRPARRRSGRSADRRRRRIRHPVPRSRRNRATLLGRRIEVDPVFDLRESNSRSSAVGVASAPISLAVSTASRSEHQTGVGAGGDARQRGSLTPTDVVEADIGASGVAALRHQSSSCGPGGGRLLPNSTAISPTCSIMPACQSCRRRRRARPTITRAPRKREAVADDPGRTTRDAAAGDHAMIAHTASLGGGGVALTEAGRRGSRAGRHHDLAMLRPCVRHGRPPRPGRAQRAQSRTGQEDERQHPEGLHDFQTTFGRVPAKRVGGIGQPILVERPGDHDTDHHGDRRRRERRHEVTFSPSQTIPIMAQSLRRQPGTTGRSCPAPARQPDEHRRKTGRARPK